MRKLEHMLSPSKIMAMEEDAIERIAGESEELQEYRRQLGQQIETLTNGLNILKKHSAAGKSQGGERAQSLPVSNMI